MTLTVVVDTNVLIAALRSPDGINRRVVRALAEGKATPLIGDKLALEYLSVCERPEILSGCPLSSDERHTFFQDFLSLCRWVRVYYLWRPNLSDESDNHVIELALAGGAARVVTNNRGDFQRGELRFPDVKVVTPHEFWEELK